MNRDGLLRELRALARKTGASFAVVPGRGKGSHYRIRFGDRWTVVKSGELSPTYVRLVKKQLGVE